MGKNYCRVVLHVSSIKSRANFVQRRPPPLKVDVCDVAIFCDTRDAKQLSPSHGNSKVLPACRFVSDQLTHRFNPEGRESNIPTRWRREIWSARHVGSSDPTMTLEHEIVRGKIIFVGDNSGSQPELLRGLECFGSGDQVRGQASREDVPWGTGSEAQENREQADLCFPHVGSRGLPPHIELMHRSFSLCCARDEDDISTAGFIRKNTS